MTFTSLGRRVSAAIIPLFVAVAAVAQVPISQHVVLVIDENHSYSDVLANMPWTVSQGNLYGYASNFKSDNGGSLLDYLWLASGSCESSANCTLPSGTHNFNCNGNDCYYSGTDTSNPITDNNIFRSLNNAGISWKVYAQSYAAAGGTPTTPDNNNGTDYYRRHNGATWYSDILSNVDGSANNIVDLSEFWTDLAAGNLPRFMIIAPDGNHDAHDCPVGMNSCTEAQQLGGADSFLEDTLSPLLSTPDFLPGGTGVIFVTFDECGDGTDVGCSAKVYTGVLGPQVTPHTVSSVPYKHENTLRTIYDSLGLTDYPGAAATAADMSDFFTSPGAAPVVTVSTPANEAALSSPVNIQASAYPTSGHTITGWQVYVDKVDMYTGGPVTSIEPSLALKSGTHSVVVRAWDSSGAYASQTLSLTITSLEPTVAVATPANQADVGSPVNIQATASPTPGHSISKWKIYVDSMGKYSAGAVNSINTNVAMSGGTHTVLIRAWDTSGTYSSQTLTLTISAEPAVAVSAPAIGANVISPINIQASAAPSSGQTITKWRIYRDDGKQVYSAGAVDSINAKISASSGTHTLTIRAWDSSGASGDQIFNVQVNTVAVNISTPANGVTATSPVKISANAASAHAITGWAVYVDSVAAFAQDNGGSISPDIVMSPGTHAVVVRAWDSTGAYGSQTITVSVP
jgi:phosphatidylinositol-3-phosphatase